jgi:hypothetical protein
MASSGFDETCYSGNGPSDPAELKAIRRSRLRQWFVPRERPLELFQHELAQAGRKLRRDCASEFAEHRCAPEGQGPRGLRFLE